eukprot:scpid31218/ scgid1497/ Ankyrin-3; Ankyrin-G
MERCIQASINTNGGSEGWYDPDPYCVRFDLSRDMTDAEVDKLPKLVYGNRDVKAQHLAGRALADSGLLGVLMETPELAKPEGLKLTITNLYTLKSGKHVNLTGGGMIHLCAYYGSPRSASEIVRDFGSDQVNLRSECKRWTPLFVACNGVEKKMIQFLCRNGADPWETMEPPGEPPLNVLQYCLKINELASVKCLLTSGVNVNKVPETGDLLLHMAIRMNKHDAVEFLLTHGAIVHVKQNGDNCLHVAAAVKKPNMETIELLVSYGARAFETDSNGNTPAMIAASCQHTKLAAYLKEVETRQITVPELKPGSTVFVHVHGVSNAGVSTLIESLKAPHTYSTPCHLNTDCSGDGLDGLMTSSHPDPALDVDVRYVDFGRREHFDGIHAQFFRSHPVVLRDADNGTGRAASPVVVLIVVSALSQGSELEDQLAVVCQEYSAILQDTENAPRLQVLVAYTHLDSMKMTDKFRPNAVLFGVRERFAQYLCIHDKAYFVDARMALKPELARLRQSVISCCIQTMADCTPMDTQVCAAVSAMPAVRNKAGRRVVSTAEFASILDTCLQQAGISVSMDTADDNATTPSSAMSMLEALHAHREVEYIRDADLVVLQPTELWTSVISRLARLRDENCFERKITRVVEVELPQRKFGEDPKPDNTHMASTSYSAIHTDSMLQAFESLRDELTDDQLAAIVKHMTGAGAVRDKLFIMSCRRPSAPDNYRLGRWPRDAKYVKFAGRRFKLVGRPAFGQAFVNALLTSVFADLRLRYAKELLVWRDGVTGWAPGERAEISVSTATRLDFIDVVVRSRTNDLRHMYALLHLTRQRVLELHTRFSPSASLEELVISSRNIIDHVQQQYSVDRPPTPVEMFTFYTLAEVEVAAKTNAALCCNVTYSVDRPLDMLCVPSDHVSLATDELRMSLFAALPKTSSGTEKSWADLAKLLGVREKKVDVIGDTFPTDPLKRVFDMWGDRSADNTVGEIIRVLSENAVGEEWMPAIELLKQELDKPFIGTRHLFAGIDIKPVEDEDNKAPPTVPDEVPME